MTKMNSCRGANTGRFCVGLGSDKKKVNFVLRKLFPKYYLAPLIIYMESDDKRFFFFVKVWLLVENFC